MLIQAGILCRQQACVCLAQFQVPGSCLNLIYLRMVLDYTEDEVMKMNCEVQCYCGRTSRGGGMQRGTRVRARMFAYLSWQEMNIYKVRRN